MQLFSILQYFSALLCSRSRLGPNKKSFFCKMHAYSRFKYAKCTRNFLFLKGQEVHNLELLEWVPSMIHSARPTVPPVAITMLTWKLFCFVRTDTCENIDHYRPWLGAGLVDQYIGRCKVESRTFCYKTAKRSLSFSEAFTKIKFSDIWLMTATVKHHERNRSHQWSPLPVPRTFKAAAIIVSIIKIVSLLDFEKWEWTHGQTCVN